MSLTTVPQVRGGAMPAAPSSAPTPRALIDYDFQTVLRVPPKRRLVLWLMVGLIVAAAIALAVLKVDIVVSANGKIVTSDSEIVIQPVETSLVRSVAVRMGQQVKAGDVLATLDPTFSLADRDELTANCATSVRPTTGSTSSSLAAPMTRTIPLPTSSCSATSS
ncbi:MAG TPA: biotin/lipoyl-binding protein, partial [Stellaceae bacterium]|nr:biotin/lipoyl-binding protein [Stellaceae bacterium]